jgi:antitoxin MazE
MRIAQDAQALDERSLNTIDDAWAWMYIQCRYMATSTQIAKWGNSLGLRLPKSVALEAQIDEGDTVDVSVKNGAIVIRPSRPSYSLAQLVAKITPRNRHGESDWGPRAGGEVW